MPLPNPADPKQHEACCVYCKNDFFCLDFILYSPESKFKCCVESFGDYPLVLCITFHEQHRFYCIPVSTAIYSPLGWLLVTRVFIIRTPHNTTHQQNKQQQKQN